MRKLVFLVMLAIVSSTVVMSQKVEVEDANYFEQDALKEKAIRIDSLTKVLFEKVKEKKLFIERLDTSTREVQDYFFYRSKSESLQICKYNKFTDLYVNGKRFRVRLFHYESKIIWLCDMAKIKQIDIPNISCMSNSSVFSWQENSAGCYFKEFHGNNKTVYTKENLFYELDILIKNLEKEILNVSNYSSKKEQPEDSHERPGGSYIKSTNNGTGGHSVEDRGHASGPGGHRESVVVPPSH